jgi:hypothetical protein
MPKNDGQKNSLAESTEDSEAQGQEFNLLARLEAKINPKSIM